MHRILSISVLSLTLAVLSVLAKAASKDSIYATPHPAHKHQDFKHRHDQPIISDSLFPDQKTATPTDPVTHKEPCPRGCVHHGDGFYLAVTSVGDGYPRVQYTCSHPNHAQATHDGSGACSHPDHHHGAERHARAGFLDPDYVHNPADPQPEPTPAAHAQQEQQSRHGDSLGCGEGSTLYSDLHITACTKRHNHPSQQDDGYSFLSQPSARDQSQHGATFSPHERTSEDDSELHTTTMTYSHDDHPPVRSVQLTEDTIVHSISLVGHHQYIPHNVHDDWDHHRYYGEDGNNLERMPSIVDDMTKPEPIVSIAAPTSNPVHHDSASGESHYRHDIADRKAHRGEEERAGPPAPIPEPVPATSTTTGSGMKESNNNGQRYSSHYITHETVRRHEQELKPLKKGDDQRFRTIVHRVTTLIIEKETIVRPPQATPHSHHDQHYSKDDHIMFDAGVEGDMIVSIAHDEHHRRQKSKSKDEL